MVEVFERLGEVEKQQREQAAGESSAAAAAAAAAEAASAAAGHAAAAAGDAAASQTASQSAADDSARLHGSAEATHAFTASTLSRHKQRTFRSVVLVASALTRNAPITT
jgi:hypothetical protein